MAKTVCKLLGLVFFLVGLGGFAAPNLLGAHLNPLNNLVYIISGVLALYFGFAGSLSGAKGFALVFGVVYLAVGILGIVLGSPIRNLEWAVAPLELTMVEHGLHLLLGIVFLAGGLFTTTGYRLGSRFDLGSRARFLYKPMTGLDTTETGYEDQAEAPGMREEAFRAGAEEMAKEISDEDNLHIADIEEEIDLAYEERPIHLIELAKPPPGTGQLKEELTTANEQSDLWLDDRDVAFRHLLATQGIIERTADRPNVVSITELSTIPTQVFLGAATPRSVVVGDEFVARFAAYVDRFREHVAAVIGGESSRSRFHPDLYSCQWKLGTKVTVRLSARNLNVQTPALEFTWNGAWEVLRFDVEVPTDCSTSHAILKFDVVIAGVIVGSLRPEIDIARVPGPLVIQETEARVPRTAFASYSMRDRRNVLGRIRSLQIQAGIDVFLDCLSIRPGEQWKSEISKQIREREIFWLFWSRSAKKSKWVEWEWRSALAAKTLDGIQPHPLESINVAPPPPELEELQFGNAYECYLMTLHDSWFRHQWQRIKSVFGRLSVVFSV